MRPASKPITPRSSFIPGSTANGVELADTSAHGEIAYSFWVKGSVGLLHRASDENTRIYSPFGFANNNTEYFVVDPEASITNGGVHDLMSLASPRPRQ
jgi:hypothetical protein